MATEKRLIDANALEKALRTDKGADALGHSVVKLLKIDAIIEEQPEVDAVEVVRCKDCKHYNQWDRGCDYHGYYCYVHVDRDDFCSYGERREGE